MPASFLVIGCSGPYSRLSQPLMPFFQANDLKAQGPGRSKQSPVGIRPRLREERETARTEEWKKGRVSLPKTR